MVSLSSFKLDDSTIQQLLKAYLAMKYDSKWTISSKNRNSDALNEYL